MFVSERERVRLLGGNVHISLLLLLNVHQTATDSPEMLLIDLTNNITPTPNRRNGCLNGSDGTLSNCQIKINNWTITIFVFGVGKKIIGNRGILGIWFVITIYGGYCGGLMHRNFPNIPIFLLWFD